MDGEVRLPLRVGKYSRNVTKFREPWKPSDFARKALCTPRDDAQTPAGISVTVSRAELADYAPDRTSSSWLSNIPSHGQNPPMGQGAGDAGAPESVQYRQAFTCRRRTNPWSYIRG